MAAAKRQPVGKSEPSKKNEPERQPVRRELAALIKKMNDEAGHDVIRLAEDAGNPYQLRRPSGIMPLDLDMAGGAPAGGMIKLTGPENAGKTYLEYLFMAMHQRIYGANSVIGVGYTEWMPDHFQMRLAGMQVAIPDEMIARKNKARMKAGLPPFTKEERTVLKQQVGEVVFIHGDNGEMLLSNILDAAERDIFGIIGLDSMAMITPRDEAAKDMEEDRFNVRARAVLITNFHTKMHYMYNTRKKSASGPNETTLILIDQVRANTDKASMQPFMQKFAKNYKESSPHAGKHSSMMTIMLSEGTKTKATSGKLKGATLGKQIKWDFLKGSKGTHNHIQGEAYYEFARGVDLQHSVVTSGLRTGIIHEKGGELHVRNAAGTPVLENIKGGPEELMRLMREDFQLEMDIRQFILQVEGHECVYD